MGFTAIPQSPLQIKSSDEKDDLIRSVGDHSSGRCSSLPAEEVDDPTDRRVTGERGAKGPAKGSPEGSCQPRGSKW